MPMQIALNHDSPLDSLLTRSSFGAVEVLTATGTNHAHTRSERDVVAGDPDTLQIALSMSGSTDVEQDGRQARATAGEIIFFDSSRPFRLSSERDFDLQVWAVPKALLRLSQKQSQLITATPLSTRSGVTRIVDQFLRTTLSHRTTLEIDPQVEAIGQHAVDLVGTLIHSSFGKTVDIADATAVLHEQIRSFIQLHHVDVDLNPSVIARAHHVSLRKLHAVFATYNLSVMDAVRSVRLEAVRRELNDERFTHLTLGNIAARHGFSTFSGFSRAFKAQFGVTPAGYRQRVRVLAPPPEESIGQFEAALSAQRYAQDAN